MSTASNRPFLTVPLTKGLSAQQVRKGIARGSRLTDVGKRTLAFFLHEMQARGLHAQTGHVSAAHYAERVHGLKPRTARHYAAIGEALDQLPRIDGAFREGRLQWSRLKALVPIATPETEAEWLEKALAMTCAELERAVAGMKKGERPRSDRLAIPKVRYTVTAKLDGLAFARWELAKERLSSEAGETVTDADLLRHLSGLVLDGGAGLPEGGSGATVVVNRCADCRAAQVATADGPIAIEPSDALALECDNRAASLRVRVLDRDGRRCVHCASPFELHAHHVQPREAGGPGTEENLVTLCRRCHGLVHDGCLSITGTAPHGLAMTDKDGNPVAPRTAPGTEGIEIRAKSPRGPRGPRPNHEVVDLQRLPNPASPEFLASHSHLFDFSRVDEGGEVTFTPGVRRPTPPVRAPLAPPPPDRPRGFEDFIGQSRAKDTLRPSIEDARRRGAPLAPVLLSGSPGLGKTALAYAIAGEMGEAPRLLNGAHLKDEGKTLASLLAMADGDVVFIDEIHALPRAVMVSLFEVLQDRRLTITVRSGVESRQIAFELPKITILAATSEPEEMVRALESRFSFRLRLEPYSPEELAAIIKKAIPTMADDAALVVGRASREVPREAIYLGERVASAAGRTPLDARRTRAILGSFRIDENGLDEGDWKILEALRESKRPMSLRTLAARTAIAEATILERHEPFLIRRKLLDVTPLGRVAG